MPSVLLVGLENRAENQFTRNLKKLNVEFEHISGDPGRINPNHDAAIFIKGSCAHQTFYDVKEIYKGKRLFVANHSFSEIREAFDDFLFKFPRPTLIIPEIKPEPMPEPIVIESPEAKQIEIDLSKLTNRERIVRECDLASMTAREAVDMLTAEGEIKSTGAKITIQEVYNIRSNYKKKLGLSETKKEDPKPKTKIRKAPTLEKIADELSVITAAPTLLDATALIRMVLSSALPQATKLLRIESITNGSMTKASGVRHEMREDNSGEFLYVEKYDIMHENPIAQLGLSKAEAQLAIDSAEAIANFALGASKA